MNNYVKVGGGLILKLIWKKTLGVVYLIIKNTKMKNGIERLIIFYFIKEEIKLRRNYER